MPDPTENMRRKLVSEINHEPGSREALEQEYEIVWNTDELRADFDVIGFAAPLVVVCRRSDGVRGSLLFQHWPRFYFGFRPGVIDCQSIFAGMRSVNSFSQKSVFIAEFDNHETKTVFRTRLPHTATT